MDIVLPPAYRPHLSARVRRAIRAAMQTAEQDADALWRIWAARWLIGIDRTDIAVDAAIPGCLTAMPRDACRQARQLAVSQDDGTDQNVSDEHDAAWNEERILERIIIATATSLYQSAPAHVLQQSLAHGGDVVTVIDGGKTTRFSLSLLMSAAINALNY